jgi:PIN domain nuclease of toxin-antitoxin system
MNSYVNDTHALLWHPINSPALGVSARLAFDEADAGQALIYIPAIVIAELYYLNEKKGRPPDVRTKYARLAQGKQFVLLPFYPSHTLDFDACSAVTEMHDRIIAADARRTNATLLTRDAKITSSGVVATVW